MPLNHILRKCAGEYKLHKSQETKQSPNVHGRHQNLAKNEKELETLIQTVKIYSEDIGMEFGIEKCTMVIMKSGKRQITEGIELSNKEKSECSEKRKLTNTWKYWKRTP